MTLIFCQNKNFRWPFIFSNFHWLAFDDSNQLSPVSDQVLDKSDVQNWRKCPKTRFLSEIGQIWTKKGSPKYDPDFLFSWTIFKAIGESRSKIHVEFVWKSYSITFQRFSQNVKIQFLTQDICVWVRLGVTEIALFPI